MLSWFSEARRCKARTAATRRCRFSRRRGFVGVLVFWFVRSDGKNPSRKIPGEDGLS